MPPAKGYIPMKWSDTRERELLLRIISQLSPSVGSIDWQKISAPMGDDATEAACKLKFTKLKKAGDEMGVKATGVSKTKAGTKRMAATDGDDAVKEKKVCRAGGITKEDEEDNQDDLL